MKLILRTGLLAATMLALVGTNPAHAIYGGSVGSGSKCLAGKAKCIVKLKSCMLGCYAKGGDPACLTKCRTGFLADPANGKGCMEKLDAKDVKGGGTCGGTLGDAAMVRSKVEAHVAELVATLNPANVNTPNKCLAGKNKCVTKYNACVLGIVAKALQAGGAIGDLSKCNAILTNSPKASCVQKLEDKGNCLTTGDQGDLKVMDDAFVNDILFAWLGGDKFKSRRCVSDTSVVCASDGDCSGGPGDCQYFFGGPLPLSAGGVTTCLTNQWDGPLTGTFNQATGASAGTAKVLARVYNGITLDHPCPVCVGAAEIPNDGVKGGTCNGGTRHGQACDSNGEASVPAYGFTSLDCPPLPGGQIAALSVDLTNTNDGTITKTLTAASPNCNGKAGSKCLCATCSLNQNVACMSDADCAAVSAGTCTNAAGEPRKPNSCVDDTSTGPDESICTPTAGGEGQCPDSPVDQHCKIEMFRGCSDDSQCPVPGDICVVQQRPCFPGYNGNLGDKIEAKGVHSAPHNHTGTATFAGVFCVAPTGSSAINQVSGLPGPARLALNGVSGENGTDSTCPTKAYFLPTAKGGPLDAGWTGISHDSRIISQGKVTLGVTTCTGSPGSCVCSYTGPIDN